MRSALVVVLGVGVAAIVGVMLFKKRDAVDTVPGPAPGPAPQGPPPAPGYATTSPAPGQIVTLGDPLNLKKGQYYRGKILNGQLTPFDPPADHDTVARGLSALGFADVKVFMSPADLPSNWPSQVPRSGRGFQARWSGLTGQVPRPSQVEMMWVTSSANANA